MTAYQQSATTESTYWPDHQVDAKRVPGGIAVGSNILARNERLDGPQTERLLRRAPTAVYTIPVSSQFTTLTWDTDSGLIAQVTLSKNSQFLNPVNVATGDVLLLELVQDATGSRTVTWGNAFVWASGSAPTLSTAANASDFLVFRALSPTRLIGWKIGEGGSAGADATARAAAAAARAIADAALPRAGGTMTGALTLAGDPSADLHAATKQYNRQSAGGR